MILCHRAVRNEVYHLEVTNIHTVKVNVRTVIVVLTYS
jgi:hypothetical protein